MLNERANIVKLYDLAPDLIKNLTPDSVEKRIKGIAKAERMTLGKRYGAGAVVFADEHDPEYEDARYFLLLKVFGQWVLPKGGVDEGESLMKAAKREVFEEAGLRLKMIKGWSGEIKYPISSEFIAFGKSQSFDVPKMKIVSYYLGQSPTFSVRLSKEHEDYRWEEYEDAMRYLRHKEQPILQSAAKYLNSKGI